MIIVTSEQRVGSRWLHYLLADLYDMKPSGEMDVVKLYEKNIVKTVEGLFKQNRIPKFHRATPIEIIHALGNKLNYKIVSVVRDPRDRAVSLAFHNRYHPVHEAFMQKAVDTDEEAVRVTVLKDQGFLKGNIRQAHNLMWFGSSTRNFINDFYPYMWTTYEWLKESLESEIASIDAWSGLTRTNDLAEVCERHQFKAKSGRKEGEEVRSDLWRRKGIVGDWKNWFDDEMVEATRNSTELYEFLVDRA